MASARIVEAVDVLKERDLDLSSGLPRLAPDQFSLQRFEESLDHRIVVAVAFAAHRDLEAMLPQPLLIVVRTILAAPIRMMRASW